MTRTPDLVRREDVERIITEWFDGYQWDSNHTSTILRTARNVLLTDIRGLPPAAPSGLYRAVEVVERQIEELIEIRDDDHALFEGSYKDKCTAVIMNLGETIQRIRALTQETEDG
jgi:hypothetical protein